MTETFKAAPDGLPGNDDLGATSAWYVWSAIGLYPAIPGVGGFVIGSPSFSSVKIRLGDGRQIQIVADGKPPKNPYVQSLTLNGKPYSRTWLPVESFRSSTSILKFTLAGTPNPLWGSAVADMPPSFTIGQSPAIGFIYGDDYLSVTPGGETKFSLGVQKLFPNR